MSRRAWALWWLCVALLGVAQAWLAYARREALAEAHRLAEHKRALLLRVEKLHLERAALLRPHRLQRLAAQLGMGPPRPEQVQRDEGHAHEAASPH